MRSSSSEELFPPFPGRPSQGRLWDLLPPGLAESWASCPRPASCCLLGVSCCLSDFDTGLHPRWWADEGAAAGGGVGAAADRRGRMWLIASVWFWAGENCWAKLSTALPNRPTWDMGESRNRYLSVSLILARFNHRWRSWTTKLAIASPTEHAVTIVVWRARSLAVHSCPRSCWSRPPRGISMSALAW